MRSSPPKPHDKDAFSELGVTATLLLIYAAARCSIESNTLLNGNDAKITNAQRNMRKTITLGQPGETG